MAYFRRNREDNSRENLPAGEIGRAGEEDYSESYDHAAEDEEDDGFDEITDEEEDGEELPEEYKQELRRKRIRAASGAGNISAVIIGALAILVLLTLLLNMISFVINDASRNFTLFQTKL